MKQALLLTLVVLFVLSLAPSMVYAGVTEMRIWTDELMDPDPGQMNPVTGVVTRYGQKSEPATFYVIRWCVNRENEHNFMTITDDAAAGPYGMELGMGEIPSNNCWMDLRRTDAAPGWDYPLDASATERVTFWVKADSGTAPFWFMGQSYKPSDPPVQDPNLSERQYSVNVFVDGETIINFDDFGDMYVHRDRHFNGEWQFVSIPWEFLTMTDSALVDEMIPFSLVWEGSVKDTEGDQSSFDYSRLRTIKWHTKPESESLIQKYWNSPDNLWGDPGEMAPPGVWSLDEIIFTLNEGTGIVNVDGEKDTVPLTYELSDNYPNPFNPTTTISYAVPVSNNVTIEIYNAIGAKVRTLVDRYVTAGHYKATWDGKNDQGQSVPSGTYFYKMHSSHFNTVKKMTLIK